MLLNEQPSYWLLETSWRSCGVTVITTPFRYYKWLRLQWESVDVSLVQVMACRLFGAKPLPEPVEGPVIWNVMVAMLRQCSNNATKRDFGITNDYISNERLEVCFVISQNMLLNKQSSDWWLGTPRRSCGVTVITTPFRYCRWLRLHWKSADVSFAISKGILLNNSQAAECLKRRDAQVVSL